MMGRKEDAQVYCAKFAPTEALVRLFETTVCMRFGKQLRNYLLSYGCLARGDVVLCGLNGRLGMEYDLAVQTSLLVKRNPSLAGYACLERLDADTYMVVDGSDRVSRFSAKSGKLKDSGMDVNAYIRKRVGVDMGVAT